MFAILGNVFMGYINYIRRYLSDVDNPKICTAPKKHVYSYAVSGVFIFQYCLFDFITCEILYKVCSYTLFL